VFENRVLRGVYLGLRGRKWREAGEDGIMSCTTSTLHQALLGNQDKGFEMGGTCSTHGSDEKIYSILVGKYDKNHSEDLDVDGRIILKYILRS
jgi:hypothetical protein